MEKNEPLISVIVPVYDVEKYLSKCLDSLLAQTWRNLEIIVVNDGSPDGSWDIMQDYAARDSRIRLRRQKNGGLSAARTLNGSCENFVPDKKRLTKRTKNAIFFL